MTDLGKLEKRIADLEAQVSSGKKPKAPKVPRKPSDYNKFMKKFFEDSKKDKSSTKTHRELFTDAAKAWSAEKVKL